MTKDAGQAVTYPKETLASSVEVGGKKYYMVDDAVSEESGPGG